MSGEFFQRFADTLAGEVRRELIYRGVSLLASVSKGVKPDRYLGYNGVYQVSMVVGWPKSSEIVPSETWHVRKWAIEMGLKLARPGVLSTYEMELPRGVRSAMGRAEDLLLRCVVDYSIHEDMEILRVDALAKWDE